MEAPKQGVNRNRQSRATAEGAHADLGGKKKSTIHTEICRCGMKHANPQCGCKATRPRSQAVE